MRALGLARPVLLLIDLQRAVDDPSWGPRNQPDAEKKAGALLGFWREHGLTVIHVRHDSVEPASTYRPGQPLHEFKPECRPAPAELVIAKSTNSAFIGTDLEQRLRALATDGLFVAGVSTANSVDATVRMAGNFGFPTFLIEDATFTFAKTDRSGRIWPAEDVQALSVAHLDGEYARIVSSAEVMAAG